MPQISQLQAEIDAAGHTAAYPRTVTLTPGVYSIGAAESSLVISSALRVLAHDVEIHVGAGKIGVLIQNLWTTLEGLVVRGPHRHGDDSGSVGVVVRGGRPKLIDCILQNLDTGIELDGKSGNVNGWTMQGMSVWHCRLGVHVHGKDANAGRSVGLDLNQCVRSIEDTSFLGNTWISTTVHPDVHLVDKPAINETSKNSFSTWLGTYIEGKDPGFSTNSNYAVVVGNLGPRHAVGRADRIGARRSKLVFSDDPATGVEVTMGADSEIPIRWRHADGQRMSIRRAGNLEGFTEGTNQGMADRGVFWKLDLNED